MELGKHGRNHMSKDDFIKIKKEQLPDDLDYQGVSGHSYYLSFAHYWSETKGRTFYQSYLGDWYVYKEK
jgi:hypothetical protein